MFHVPNKYRVRSGPMGSGNNIGNNGAFIVRSLKKEFPFAIMCVVSDQDGWEHVSVTVGGSAATRTPTWEEMCFIKELFWDEEDCVMQLHPPESDYINNHPHCLHLWRPIGVDIIRPPSYMVGYKD